MGTPAWKIDVALAMMMLALAAIVGCGTTPDETAESPMTPAGDEAPAPASEASTAPAPALGPLTAALEAAQTEVALGDPIALTFTLRNLSEDRTVRVKEIVDDVQSVSLEIEWGEGIRFEYAQRTLWGEMPREWETVVLVPGASAEGELALQAVRPGSVRITGVYRGAADEGQGEVRTSPIDVEVIAESPGDEVVAVLATNFGTIRARLFPDDAPNTVLHFAELIRDGFYDDTLFHRLIPGFVIQGGDPEGTGGGGPGFTLKGEFNDRKHVPGVLSMARTDDPDSAGSQFFICLAPAPHLDGQYTAFGEVVAGFEEVVRKMEQVETYEGTDRPAREIVIERATLEVENRKR